LRTAENITKKKLFVNRFDLWVRPPAHAPRLAAGVTARACAGLRRGRFHRQLLDADDEKRFSRGSVDDRESGEDQGI
jgi:hypothetical protein